MESHGPGMESTWASQVLGVSGGAGQWESPCWAFY